METGPGWRGGGEAGRGGEGDTRPSAAAPAGGRPLESGWHKSHAQSQETTTLNLNWLPFKYHLSASFPASLSG